MNKRFSEGVIPEENIALRRQLASDMKQARVSLDMTQQVLADIVGTKKSNISRMESGKYNPTLDFMVKVASGMGKTVSISLGDREI